MSQTKKYDIFISYSKKDLATAKLICGYLEDQGEKCFMDKTGLVPGRKYPTQLPNAIKESRVFVLVFSSNSDSSESVQNEVAIAKKYKVPIIPIRIEDIRPSGLEYFIITDQWLDAFSSPIKQHLPKILQAVKDNLNEEQEIQSAKQTTEEIHMTTKSREKIKRATIIEVGEYARDILEGMGLSPSGAREFSELWVDKYGDCDFDEFKRVFNYAHDVLGGMGKSPLNAKEFGLLWMDNFRDCEFDEFKRLYYSAYSTLEGMGLSPREAEEFALKHLSKSQKQMPPMLSPSPVISFSGSGRVNTRPFAMGTSPWTLRFSTNWSGHFAVQLRNSGIELVINQGVKAGKVYETVVYRHTGNNLYFHIYNAPVNGEWSLSVIE